VAPPITLEQLVVVVRAGSANVRSGTQDALDKAKNHTSWLESVLEKIDHYSSLGALARQVKNGCVENGCGMTYPQVAAELQKTCSDSQLRPFYIEQWKRQQGHVMGGATHDEEDIAQRRMSKYMDSSSTCGMSVACRWKLSKLGLAE
jgi:hypothetical protein